VRKFSSRSEGGGIPCRPNPAATLLVFSISQIPDVWSKVIIAPVLGMVVQTILQTIGQSYQRVSCVKL